MTSKKTQRGAKRRRKKRKSRPLEEYIVAANKLSAIVPSLKKYKKRKTLKPSEKGRITRREKQLHNIPWLHPISATQAKKIRKLLFAPGVNAVQMRNVPPGSKIKIKKNEIEVITPGQEKRRWLYWRLDRKTVRSRVGMREAGSTAFEKKFPIEKISDLAANAFNKLQVIGVSLWAHAGRVGDTFESLGSFIRWVNEKWSAGRYMRSSNDGGSSEPDKWVNGIAIWVQM